MVVSAMKPIGKLRKIPSLLSERASLDTHVWLWAFLEPHNPASAVLQSLSDSKNVPFSFHREYLENHPPVGEEEA